MRCAHILAIRAQALRLTLLVRLGETERVERALDDMDGDARAEGEMRLALAELRLARDNPEGAAAALAPIFDGASPIQAPRWEIQAHVLKAKSTTPRATPPPVPGRWSARLSLPSPTDWCFRSCWTRRRACSSATRDFAPLTRH